jgi:TolA-binding protein
MPVLPVPEVVKEMATRIDQIAQQVNDVDRKVERLFDGLHNLKSTTETMKSIGMRVDALNGSLAVARDQLAMLCAAAEKTN